MRNRLLLLGLVIIAWFLLQVIDWLLPWPAICVLLAITLVIMVMHSIWLLLAQSRQMKKLKDLSRNTNSEIKEITAVAWTPSVDILIPAKNEARVIERTVRNLFQLDYQDFSICVIDDASTDETPSILERLQKEFPRLKILKRPQGSYPGKSAGLNDALPYCRAEVIAVFDADAYVESDFLKQILPNLQADKVGAVQAQKKIFAYQKGVLPYCQASEYALDTYFQVGRNLIGGAVELRGNGEIIKRAALIDVGGWNNKAITDDLDLTMRLLIAGWDVNFSPDTIVWEEAVTTLKALMRQRRRWAEGSIRRYLDYIFPLNAPNKLSIVERLDILAFLSEFAVPGLMLLQLIAECFNFLTGGNTHSNFLLLVAGLVLIISMVNFFIALRFYRSELGVLRTLVHVVEVNLYVYAHWVPCVLVSFLHIIFSQQASTWHRTERAKS